MRHQLASGLWRVVWLLTKTKRKLADWAFLLDNSRRTL